MKITLEISNDNITHSQIECDGTFDETLQGIRLAIQELEFQIENRNKCPFSKNEKITL